MTAIAAWCGAAPDDGATGVARLLATMPGRGDLPTTTRCADAWLGASPFEWQVPWTGPATGRSGAVAVVADATLYYVDDLVAALAIAGVAPASRLPADLIAAAVVAWGDDAASHLEGDFAFVAVDEESGTARLARDWGGLRSLYAAASDRFLACASEAEPLTLLPGVDGTLNLPWLAEAIGGRFESPLETAFLGVQVIPAGSTWRWGPEGGSGRRTFREVRSFEPPPFRGEERADVPFSEAKAQLRMMMEAAVRERIPASGDVSVALSGGRDSPAVYALARRIAGERVRSMSVSYPEGDPGREDDTILEVLETCGGEPHWIRSDEIGILATMRQGARGRHEPFGHAFAEFQEALARAARQLETRVLLNGSGGDQLFSGEPTYLADMLRAGRFRALLQEWRKLHLGADARAFCRLAVWPNLGPLARRAFGMLRGRRLPDPFDHELPRWLRRDFARRAELETRHQVNFPSRAAAGSAANFERRWLLTHPYFARVFAEAFRLFLKEGVELRTPLADGRLLRLAATRPRWERREGWQVKSLMRNALADVLPPGITRDRPRPTGTTEGLLAHAVREQLRALVEDLAPEMELGRLGIVDPVAWQRVRAELDRSDASPAALDAVYTALVETWLRARRDASPPGTG